MQTFKDMGIEKNILKAIEEIGFEVPTPIQEETIPVLLSSRRDVVAQAQTGTGKTAAFGLPIIQQSDADDMKIQTIILSPTRELCIQISDDLKKYSKYMKDIRVIPIYGGAGMEPQIKSLKRGGQIVVGTPGRVNDLIRRRKLNLSGIKWLVLDEADEMLNMGFKDDLDSILKEIPEKRQTLLFSATMPQEIRKIAKKYMSDAISISAGKENIGAENVEHEYYMVYAKDKYLALKRIVDMYPDIYAIVFCRTRNDTKNIADKLIGDGYNADALHGDMSQIQREIVMGRFRNRHLRILVATDVAARGLDVNDLTHIINYSLPDEPGIYIHRSGRTGRAGKKGVSISIIHKGEKGKLKIVEKKVGKNIEYKKLPDGRAICEAQLFGLIDKVKNVEINEAEIEQYLPEIYKKLDSLSREELIKKFVSVEFNRFLMYYSDAKILNQDINSNKNNAGMRFTRFRINVGAKNNLSATKLINLINEHTLIRNIEIGNIDIFEKYSFFEIDSEYENETLKSLERERFNGVRLNIEKSAEQVKNTQRGKRGKKGKSYSAKKSYSSSKNFDRAKRGGGNRDGKNYGRKNKRNSSDRGRRG